MKHNRTTLLVLSVFALAAILLSACGPAATPSTTGCHPGTCHSDGHRHWSITNSN